MDLYADFLSLIAQHLKQHSFKKRGKGFLRDNDFVYQALIPNKYKRYHERYGAQLVVTFDVGLSSRKLALFEGVRPELTGHWGERLGTLAKGEDYWWTLEPASFQSTVDEVIHYIDTLAIPKLEEYDSDQKLLQLFLSDQRRWQDRKLAMRDLLGLLKCYGPEHLYQTYLDEYVRESAHETQRRQESDNHFRDRLARWNCTDFLPLDDE